jgi:hypothetical protein
MTWKIKVLTVILLSGFCVSGRRISPGISTQTPVVWETIKPYFTPPEKYLGKYGNYPNPLIFYDGKKAKNKKQWPDRRKEILDYWHGKMGEWPPFIENQQMEILEIFHREDFFQKRIRFKWTPNETAEGYLLIPDQEERMPAVVTVYYEPETSIGLGQPDRDFAFQLAKRGFVTLSIGTKKATEAKTYSIYYPDIGNASVQPLSMLAYASGNVWYLLSQLDFVDSTRIGIMGHSFGGKWAMFASCLFDKYACAVWSDPGIVFQEDRPDINYWEPWYLGYDPPPWRERGLITADNPAGGIYPQLLEEGRNLTELHALMAPRPFLVSGGSEDSPERWSALNFAIAVNRLLGYENRVAMTNRKQHSPDSLSNAQAYQFFEYFLKK